MICHWFEFWWKRPPPLQMMWSRPPRSFRCQTPRCPEKATVDCKQKDYVCKKRKLQNYKIAQAQFNAVGLTLLPILPFFRVWDVNWLWLVKKLTLILMSVAKFFVIFLLNVFFDQWSFVSSSRIIVWFVLVLDGCRTSAVTITSVQYWPAESFSLTMNLYWWQWHWLRSRNWKYICIGDHDSDLEKETTLFLFHPESPEWMLSVQLSFTPSPSGSPWVSVVVKIMIIRIMIIVMIMVCRIMLTSS